MPFTSVTLVVMVSMDCAGCRDLVGLVREGIEGLDVVGAIGLPLPVRCPTQPSRAISATGGVGAR